MPSRARGTCASAPGLQAETIGNTRLWVFPNPSGLNARFQVTDYARMFRLLKTKKRAGA